MKDKEYFIPINGMKTRVKFLNAKGISKTLIKYRLTTLKEEREYEDGKSQRWGMYLGSKCEILVNNSTCTARKEETVLHEIVHAILSSYGYDHDEDLIGAIASGFNQLGVGKHLMKRIKKG